MTKLRIEQRNRKSLATTDLKQRKKKLVLQNKSKYPEDENKEAKTLIEIMILNAWITNDNLFRTSLT